MDGSDQDGDKSLPQLALLAAIVDSSFDAVISKTLDGTITSWNAAAARIFGYSATEAIGHQIAMLVPPERQDEEAWILAQLRAGERVENFETVRVRRDGTRIDVAVTSSPVRDAEGRIVGASKIVRDVSSQRQALADRRTLEGQLREAQKMEAVGTLAGGIAHDVNNALGSILANAALAREDLAADHPARTSVEQIDIAAQRARAVVRQILASSRRQAQELVVQPLAPLVAEALALLRSTLPSVVRLEAQVPAADLHVLADANQIHQVLLNLCTNAWHALRGSTGRIVVGAERVELDAAQAVTLGLLGPGPHVRLWVADNGSGMDAATRARVFEPFFTTKPRGEGTGLGLAVVHGIVHAHAGAIAVHSEVGVGTRFEIYLPLAEASPDAAAAPTVVDAGAALTGAGVRVAYVDDDEMMLLVVERLLQRRGFAIECHAEPAALLERLRHDAHGLDIVVSDFNMPAMNGIELAHAVAALAPALPVIVSSGYLSEELRDSARAAGVRALLEKEDTLERLVPLIASVLASGG